MYYIDKFPECGLLGPIVKAIWTTKGQGHGGCSITCPPSGPAPCLSLGDGCYPTFRNLGGDSKARPKETIPQTSCSWEPSHSNLVSCLGRRSATGSVLMQWLRFSRAGFPKWAHVPLGDRVHLMLSEGTPENVFILIAERLFLWCSYS